MKNISHAFIVFNALQVLRAYFSSELMFIEAYSIIYINGCVVSYLSHPSPVIDVQEYSSNNAQYCVGQKENHHELPASKASIPDHIKSIVK